MLRLVPLLALLVPVAGCIGGPTEAHVDWKTTGAPATPDADLGAMITYDGEYGGDSTWLAGVQGITVVDVYSNHICATLEHRTLDTYEQLGQEKTDYSYEARSASVCIDAEMNDHGVYSPTFELAYHP